MIIKRHLRVSAEQYYDYLLTHLHIQLKRDVSNTIKKKDLVKGFEVKKTYMHGTEKVSIEFTIEEMSRPELYRISFKTEKGSQFVSHRIKKIRDNFIEDEYEEDFQTNDIKLKLKALIDASRTRQNMAKTISIIEKEIKVKNIKESNKL